MVSHSKTVGESGTCVRNGTCHMFKPANGQGLIHSPARSALAGSMKPFVHSTLYRRVYAYPRRYFFLPELAFPACTMVFSWVLFLPPKLGVLATYGTLWPCSPLPVVLELGWLL
ncbi:hypothetical protein BDW74DRAFT_141501 [Aspergillus multicolor]|uniref:uncharacterized protein n=1 Tax=Aspergillus multicolor TaxID=41759 RepID=UPI003CCCC6C9